MKFLNYKETSKLINDIVKYSKNNNLNKDYGRSDFLKAIKILQNSNINTNKFIKTSFGEIKINKLENEPYTSDMGPINYFSKKEQIILKRKIKKAIGDIKLFNLNLYKIANLIISDIVIVKGNGTFPSVTNSNLLCTIYLVLNNTKVKNEYLTELIIHELTHLNIFLVDMVYGLYSNTKYIDQKVISSVRINQIRNFEPTFHAACVAIIIMCFYDFYNKTGYYNKYSEPLKDSLKDLIKYKKLLNKTGKEILKEVCLIYQKKEFNKYLKTI